MKIIMTNGFPPGLLFIIGALLIPIFRGWTRNVYLLLIPFLAFFDLLTLSEGVSWTFHFLDYPLVFARVDRLALLFGYLFVIAAFACTLFSIHLKNNGELISSYIYIGSALGVVFSGDLISLFIFWELMSLASTYLIWARGAKSSEGAGIRYFLNHFLGGLILFSGILLHIIETGSTQFDFIGLDSPSSWLILIGFAFNAAIPFFHGWLTDAYPEATVTGTVFLSSFTTKTAVYALARSFPGTEVLIGLGTLMTLLPIFYAVLENDTRKVLAYSLINQVGFMITGIGIGTALALNGAVAHAFANVIFEGLLFMCAGSVLFMTGKTKCTDLGGLYKTMPLTLIFCLVGAASISAFPLFLGFVTKSLILSAAEHEGMVITWILLLFASAGVFHHAGIKIPFFIFFAHDSGLRTKDPPINMLLAMGFYAFLCVLIGIFPDILYRLLPFPVEYEPYTPFHVTAQLQLLFFSALAFIFLKVYGLYPPEERAVNVDVDWLYRKGAWRLVGMVDRLVSPIVGRVARFFLEALPLRLAWFSKHPVSVIKYIVGRAVLWIIQIAWPGRERLLSTWLENEREGYPGESSIQWPIGSTVLWVVLFLLGSLLIYYL